MSPELLDPQQFGFEKIHPTKHSDCYALGMVIYETISGHLPFHQHTDFTVVLKVQAGERPSRGVGFTDSQWKMLELCWTSRPNDRPSIEDVLWCLGMAQNLSEPPSPGVDEEMEGYDDWDLVDSSPGVDYDCDADSGFPSRPPPKNSTQQRSGWHPRRTPAWATKNTKAFLFFNKFKLGSHKNRGQGASKEKIPQFGPLSDLSPMPLITATPTSIKSNKPLPLLSSRQLPPIEQPQSSESTEPSTTPTQAHHSALPTPKDLSTKSGKHPPVRASAKQITRSNRSYSQQNSGRTMSHVSLSEHAGVDLVANLASRERTRQEVLFEIVSSEERSGPSFHHYPEPR